MIGIHEESLAWFYIAPGCEHDETSRRLVRSALDLLGPDAWAVIQACAPHGETLCEAAGLHIVEAYRNDAAGSAGVSVYLAQTGPAA